MTMIFTLRALRRPVLVCLRIWDRLDLTIARLAALLVVGLWSAMAPPCWAAGPTAYNCPEGHSLTAVYTPRDAHITVDGHSYELRRVRDGGEARFENKSIQARLTLSRSQATWQIGEAPELMCALRVRSLEPDALYGAGRAKTQENHSASQH